MKKRRAMMMFKIDLVRSTVILMTVSKRFVQVKATDSLCTGPAIDMYTAIVMTP